MTESTAATNQKGLKRWLPGLAGQVVYLGFFAIFVFFAITLGDDGFLTTRNLSNIVLQTAPGDDHGDRAGLRSLRRGN